jgi:DNA polymerase-3 subunit delta
VLYLFYGPNEFSQQEELAKLRAALGPAEMAGLNYTEMEGAQLPPSELAAVGQAVPFMTERRLVVVRGLLARFNPEPKKEGEGTVAADDGGWTPFLDCLRQLPPSTDLVLVEEQVHPANPLFRQCPEGTVVKEFPLPRAKELPGWIMKMASHLGGAIEPRAAQLLADSVGADLRVLKTELEKLITYAAGQPIEEGMVRSLVSQVRETSVFALVDAVMAGQPGRALQTMHQLLGDGFSPSHLLLMLGRQFRLLLQARELSAQRADSQQMMEVTGLRAQWAREKLLRQAKRYSYRQLRAAYHRLVEEDLAMKTGRRQPEVSLDLLVMELCLNRGESQA